MAQRILRPLSYGDLFDEMFDLYKKNFLLFAGIGAVVFLPICLLTFGLSSVSPLSFLFFFLLIPGSYVVMAATTLAVSRCYLGESITIKEAYQQIRGQWLGLFATMLLAGVLMTLGFFACVVPGVILAFRYAFISEVYIIENLSGKPCRARSAALAKGNEIRIFVIGLVAGILVQVISTVFTMPVQLMTGVDGAMAVGANPSAAAMVLHALAQGLAVTITGPISTIATILLYYDIRVRKEGFDVEMLAKSLGATAPTPASNETTIIN